MNHQELIEQLRKGFGTAAGRATQVNFYHMWCQKAADAIESLLNSLDVADSEVKRTAAERDSALAELAKYRDAHAVAYRHLMEDGWEYFDAPTGDDCPKCVPLIVKPDENQ